MTTVSRSVSRNRLMESYAYSSSEGLPIDEMAMSKILCVIEKRAVRSSRRRYPSSASEHRMRYSDVFGALSIEVNSVSVSP